MEERSLILLRPQWVDLLDSLIKEIMGQVGTQSRRKVGKKSREEKRTRIPGSWWKVLCHDPLPGTLLPKSVKSHQI